MLMTHPRGQKNNPEEHLNYCSFTCLIQGWCSRFTNKKETRQKWQPCESSKAKIPPEQRRRLVSHLSTSWWSQRLTLWKVSIQLTALQTEKNITVKQSDSSVMMWGCFNMLETGQFAVTDQILKSWRRKFGY